jgi:uncharacterized protein
MDPHPVTNFVRGLTRAFAADDPVVANKHLERAHVEVVTRMFENLARGDLDAFVADAADDVELEIRAPAEFPFIRRAVGRLAFRDAVAHNFGTLTDPDPSVLSMIAQGNCVVLFGRDHGRFRATEILYDVHFVYEFLLRDGKVSRVRELAAPSALG